MALSFSGTAIAPLKPVYFGGLLPTGSFDISFGDRFAHLPTKRWPHDHHTMPQIGTRKSSPKSFCPKLFYTPLGSWTPAPKYLFFQRFRGPARSFFRYKPTASQKTAGTSDIPGIFWNSGWLRDRTGTGNRNRRNRFSGETKVSTSTVAVLFSKMALTDQRIAMVDMVFLVFTAFPYLP